MSHRYFIVIFSIIGLMTSGLIAADFDPFGGIDSDVSLGVLDSQSQGPLIPMIEFSSSDISMAFQIISDATGWSIFPTAEVSRAKISLWAKKIPAGKLLDQVVTLSGFIAHRDGNTISVMTYPEYMQFFGLSQTEIRFDYADATSMAAVIKPFLTKLGKSVVHAQTNSLVLYETEANFEQLKSIMKNLDRPAHQTLVEVVDLQHNDSENIAKILNQIFNPVKGKTTHQKSDTPAKNKKAIEDTENITLSFGSIAIYSAQASNQLILVGHKGEVAKAQELIAKIDIASDHMSLEVIDVTYADAEELAQILQKLFESEKRDAPQRTSVEKANLPILGVASNTWNVQTPLSIYAVGRSNQLIAKGFRRDLDKLRKFVVQLDGFIESVTQNYAFHYINAADIYPGLERVLNLSRSGYRRDGDDSQNRHFGLTLLEQSNSIILTGPPSAHRILVSTIETADVPAPFEAGVIRTYKLENADVAEVATIIMDLIGSQNENLNNQQATFSASGDTAAGSAQSDETHRLIQQVEARVSVSKATNSVIVQTTARQHREIEQLIDELDKRRHQVLIEAFIIEVTTTDNVAVGIELSEFNSNILAFTSFGLSLTNPATQAVDVLVAPGGTAALIDPDRMKAVIRALETNRNVRIQSAPRLLINDNAIGVISSVAEAPTTQLNASDTVATTSFAGFVEAGTQFEVIPHISEEDYLRVEYKIVLNHFGSASSDSSIPPPRETTSIQSEATIPNGFTVIVGGLQNIDHSERIDKVPFFGDLPLIGGLFRSTAKQKQYKTTYLFMTPTIMKAKDFSDLKSASQLSLEQSQKELGKDKNENSSEKVEKE